MPPDLMSSSSLLSRQWSCDSMQEGLELMLKDAADSAGLSDELDISLLQSLEAGSAFVSIRSALQSCMSITHDL